MAAPNQTPKNSTDSLSIGSAEDFDICCDPCHKDDHRSEAKAFCQQCQENLCTTCLTVHKRLGVLKDHVLENKPCKLAAKSAVPQNPQNICTDACTAHKNEVIKFFCQQHNTLGCNDCMTLDHRTCDILYIPSVCDAVTKSEEYRETFKELTQAIQKGMKFEQQIKESGTKRKRSMEKALTDIESFQRRVNEAINTLKKQLEQELKSGESKDERKEDEVLSNNQILISELKSLQSTLTISETNGQDARAYTTMKRTQVRLETLKYQKELFKAETKSYTFVPNRQIEDVISSSRIFGEIVCSSRCIDTGLTIKQLKQIKKVNVKTDTDKKTCYIYGCAVLSRNQLILADWNNQKIKILDVEKESIVDECSLSSHPFDVVVLPQDQAAVTLPSDSKIQFLGTAGKMKTVRSINANRWCLGIFCYQDLLYVACQTPASVLVLDMQGTLQKEISVDTRLKDKNVCTRHIVINIDQQLLYVSIRDVRVSGGNAIVGMTLEGTVTAIYKNKELQEPDGLTMLEDGSLLVCCHGNGTIHHISADLQHGRKVTENTPKAQSICYDSAEQVVYIGEESNNFCSVLQNE